MHDVKRPTCLLTLRPWNRALNVSDVVIGSVRSEDSFNACSVVTAFQVDYKLDRNRTTPYTELSQHKHFLSAVRSLTESSRLCSKACRR